MNRKAQGGMVAVVIMAALGVILIGSLLVPTVKRSTDVQTQTENLVRDNAPNQENDTLTQATAGLTLQDAGLTITGLTLTANYTVDYDTGVVTFNTTTANGTYAASYGYYDGSYLDTAGNRAIFAVVVLAAIVGLVVVILRGFGVM